jgi:hypothetical protein
VCLSFGSKVFLNLSLFPRFSLLALCREAALATPGCSGVLKTAVVEINELLPNGMSATAANLITSDILSLARTCSALCKSGQLVSTEKIYCTQAAIDIVAAGLSLMKDEAFEYLASGELRLDPCYGCVNFDDVCYLDARAMLNISYPPQLDDVLQMWERLDAPEDYTARSADRRVKQQAGVLPLTKQFGPPDATTVLAPVANRYWSGGMQGCKFANLPRKRHDGEERPARFKKTTKTSEQKKTKRKRKHYE